MVDKLLGRAKPRDIARCIPGNVKSFVRIDATTGDFYLYGNDIARGLDIYRFEGSAARSDTPGIWLGGAEARTKLAARPKVQVKAGRDALFCLIGR